MSLTEDIRQVAEVPTAPPSSSSAPTEATARVLLVWDAPNLDMGLGSILGGRPTAAHRPRFDALGRWLLARTAELSADHPGVSLEPEATVFTNIAPGSADVVRPWVEALRNVGFAVFAKPKVDDDSDVDIDMLNHIALRRNEGLAGVLVASADGQAFKQPLEEIAREGVRSPGAWISRTCQLGTSVGYLRGSSTWRTFLVFSGSHYRESALIRCPSRGLGCSHSGRCPRY